MFDQLASWLVYELVGLHPESSFGHALHFFVMDVTKIIFLLASIIYVMGIIRASLSTEWVRDYIRSKPRWLSRLLAVILGALTPFCSCSSVPLFIGFVEAGIPIGVTFSFLIASPMINEVAVIILADIVGWQTAIVYVLSGLSIAYVGGTLMGMIHSERWIESYVWDIKVGESPNTSPQTLAQRHRFALDEVKAIVSRVWKWVIIGIAIGALFHGYIPSEWVSENLGKENILAVPGAVIIGVPLYADATSVVPIAEALLGKGVAIGTVLALMMSIAALSLPEMLILRKVVRWPALAVYTGILAVAFTLVGITFNLLL